MKFTDILKVFLLGLALSVFSGCEKETEPVALPEDVAISLGVDRVTLGSAQIRVRHQGSESVCWVYMVTKDLEADAEQMLKDKIADDQEYYDEIIAYTGRNRSCTVDDLDPKTEYRFICSAIDPVTGLLYGEVAEQIFKTRRDPSVFNVNDNWSIATGERYVNQVDMMEYDVFRCTSTDEESYLLLSIKDSDFRAAPYNSDKRKLFEDYIADMNIPVGDRRWNEVLYVGTKEHSEYRLRSGDWVVFMIGVDRDGELSGYYQQFSLTVTPEEPSAEFEKWLGNWKILDADGKEYFDITILTDEPNMWYYMLGWENNNYQNLDTFGSEMMVEVFFDKNSGDMVFVNQYVNSIVTEREMLDYYFTASFSYYPKNYVVPKEAINQKLAQATMTSSDSAVVRGYPFSFMGLEFELNELLYTYYEDNGDTPITISHDLPNFPFVMKKIQ